MRSVTIRGNSCANAVIENVDSSPAAKPALFARFNMERSPLHMNVVDFDSSELELEAVRDTQIRKWRFDQQALKTNGRPGSNIRWDDL